MAVGAAAASNEYVEMVSDKCYVSGSDRVS
jgi:hypothetical protein